MRVMLSVLSLFVSLSAQAGLYSYYTCQASEGLSKTIILVPQADELRLATQDDLSQVSSLNFIAHYSGDEEQGYGTMAYATHDDVRAGVIDTGYNAIIVPSTLMKLQDADLTIRLVRYRKVPAAGASRQNGDYNMVDKSQSVNCILTR